MNAPVRTVAALMLAAAFQAAFAAGDAIRPLNSNSAANCGRITAPTKTFPTNN